MPRKITKIPAVLLSFLLLIQQTSFAEIAVQLDIAGHLSALHQSFTQDKFRPLHLRYLEYLPKDNSFKLLIDKGTLKDPKPKDLEDTSKVLLILKGRINSIVKA